MRRLALVALTAAACTQHADGSCVWVPGDQVEAVFDGEAWVVAWSEFTYAEERYRLQLARVFADGTIGAAIEPAVISGDDQNGRFGLATDGAGGVLLTWAVRIGWRFNPGVPRARRAVWLRDGAPVGGPWAYAADDVAADACLGDEAALVTIADGFHLITTRRHCAYSPEPPRLVELRVDPVARAAVEAPSALPLDAVPPRWIAGPGGFVAHDAYGAWLVDAALATAAAAPTLPRAELVVVAATATGFVAASTVRDGEQPHVDVQALAASPAPPVTIATDYDLPADGGCAIGGGAVGLPPVLAALLRLRRRRRVAVPQRGR